MQDRRKLVRTGKAFHWDIGGRVTPGFKVPPCKEWENLPLYYIMMISVMYTNNSAEIAGEDGSGSPNGIPSVGVESGLRE